MRTTIPTVLLLLACGGTRPPPERHEDPVPVQPGCNATSCGDGCCLDGVCVRSTTPTYCGTGGQACVACPSGQVCGSYGRCQARVLSGSVSSDACVIHLAPLQVTVARPLTAVWAGATTAWAVGPEGAMVLENERLVPPPSDAAIGVGLRAVWSAGDGHAAWIVREGVDAAIRRELLGQSVEERSPTGAPLRAIWGRSDDDVWAAGDEGRAAHWDGKSWSVHQPADEPILGVAGQPTGSAFAVTASKLYREDGGRFVLAAAAPGPLTGALAVTTNAVWAGGQNGDLHRLEAGTWETNRVGISAPAGLWPQTQSSLFFTQPGGMGFMGPGTVSLVPFEHLSLAAISGTAPNRAVAVGGDGAVLARCAKPDELPQTFTTGPGGTSGTGGGHTVYCYSYCVIYSAAYGCLASGYRCQ